MKYRRIFALLLLLLLLSNGGIKVSAMNTGFSTVSLPEDDIFTFLKNVNISMLADEPKKKAIECFDVNKKGMVAIGQEGAHGKEVCIYSSNGTFLYGYTFTCSGGFGVEWDGDNINFYFVRSSVIVSITPNGEILDVFEVQNTIENNSYMNHFIHSTERSVGDTKYVVRNNIGILNLFASSYSQMVTIDIAGEESIIYEVSSTQFSNMVVIFIGVILLVCLAVGIIIWQFVKLKQ